MRLLANDLHVNCQFSGPRQAPLVVLRHSLASSAIMWEQQMPVLVDGSHLCNVEQLAAEISRGGVK